MISFPVYNQEGIQIDFIQNPDKKILDELTDQFIRVYCDASVKKNNGNCFCAISSIVVAVNKVVVDHRILEPYLSTGSIEGEYNAICLSIDLLNSLDITRERVFVYSDISSINRHLKKTQGKYESVISHIHEKTNRFTTKFPDAKMILKNLYCSMEIMTNWV
jgi:hypothetical protein